ncbi:hypothetical protein ES708_15783 [subsurface metagenome]
MKHRVTLSRKQIALLIELFKYLDRNGVDFAIAPELQELWGRLMTVQANHAS